MAGANNDTEDINTNKFLRLERDFKLLEKHDLRFMGELDVNKEQLRVLIEESLSSGLEIFAGTGRFVEVFIGRCAWTLRGSDLNLNAPSNTLLSSANTILNNNILQRTTAANAAAAGAGSSTAELIEVGFIGLYGTMTYGEDRCSSALLEIQRLWARNLDPGPESSPFDDKVCVMIPVLSEQEYCTRCMRPFDLNCNSSNACIFHADSDGNPGVYKEVVKIDELTGAAVPVFMWTCCNRHHELAPGCSARPHMCKEVMVTIRAEANPPTKIEDVEVTVLKTLEVSIFPGANYDLQLQLTRSMADLLHKYFSIDKAEGFDLAAAAATAPTNSADTASSTLNTAAVEDIKESSSSADAAMLVGGGGSAGGKKQSVLSKLFGGGGGSKTTESAEKDAPQQRKSSLWSSSNTSAQPVSERKRGMTATEDWQSRKGSMQRGSNATTKYESRSTLNTDAITAADAAKQQQQQQRKRQEALYVRYLRVGDINVDVSTAGFTINLDKFKAVMESFYCRNTVLSWASLVWLLEKHMVWSLTKHTARNQLTRVGEFFGFGRASIENVPSSLTGGGKAGNTHGSGAGGGTVGAGGGSGGGRRDSGDKDDDFDTESAQETRKRELLLGAPPAKQSTAVISRLAERFASPLRSTATTTGGAASANAATATAGGSASRNNGNVSETATASNPQQQWASQNQAQGTHNKLFKSLF